MVWETNSPMVPFISALRTWFFLAWKCRYGPDTAGKISKLYESSHKTQIFMALTSAFANRVWKYVAHSHDGGKPQKKRMIMQ